MVQDIFHALEVAQRVGVSRVWCLGLRVNRQFVSLYYGYYSPPYFLLPLDPVFVKTNMTLRGPNTKISLSPEFHVLVHMILHFLTLNPDTLHPK